MQKSCQEKKESQVNLPLSLVSNHINKNPLTKEKKNRNPSYSSCKNLIKESISERSNKTFQKTTFSKVIPHQNDNGSFDPVPSITENDFNSIINTISIGLIKEINQTENISPLYNEEKKEVSPPNELNSKCPSSNEKEFIEYKTNDNSISEIPLKLNQEIMEYFHIIKKMPKITYDIAKPYMMRLGKDTYFKGKKTLFLDLDETLVYTLSKDSTGQKFSATNLNFALMTNKDDEGLKTFNFVTRPHAHSFLKNISQFYEIIVNLIRFIQQDSNLMQKF